MARPRIAFLIWLVSAVVTLPESPKSNSSHPFLAGGGEMGGLIRSFDWTATPLGPVDTWSQALRTMVSILLANRFPLLLWWGPEYIQLYNDAYIPVPGTKHPKRALGRPASECWSEIWHVIGPLIDTPFRGGPATWMEDIELEIDRHGYMEESHFTIAYSPVPDDTVPSGIGGVLATVHEITDKVVAERRAAALHDLARVPDMESAEDVCQNAAAALAAHAKDIPFALIYLIDHSKRQAYLAGSHGVAQGQPISPCVVDLVASSGTDWPIAEVARIGSPTVVPHLASRFGYVPRGPWADAPDTAVALPIRSARANEPAGILVAGVSARLKLDVFYSNFLELLASQVATAIQNAGAYEEERRRAEALAELDRAKTLFFSNVSHEFRTPLTLLLGPLEEALADAKLPSPAAAALTVTHRNALRLLRLVNTLLDFSRLEAGRARACYQEIDLAVRTEELASNFQSACDRAGITLVVRCDPLPRPTFVDPDMWEKIVLNLLSNAFKFTLQGGIEVRLDASEDHARLSIRDTGVGIPETEIPRMFERFHRVKESRGRTHEGTGIGLALVQELVKLHGGSVSVESALNVGSAFTVMIPFGSGHLDPERIGTKNETSSVIGASAFLQEAMRWIPEADSEADLSLDAPAVEEIAAPAGRRARILWADDNADMRAYVGRLLGGRYDVEAVADGQAALESARAHLPDLVLADIMMPRLDGIALLRALRADPALREVPVIFLSARAGEESRIEGLDAGADDYLVKPFSARELVARVGSHLELARVRRDSRLAVTKSAEALEEAGRRKDEFLAILAHELRNPLGPVRNAAHFLKERNLPDPELRRPVEMIERQVAHMTRLIDDLLDVSRITRGMVELRLERLLFNEVIEAAVDASRDEIEGRGHTLRVAGPERPVTLLADRQRLVQVFCNLIGNAAKYTSPGGSIELLAGAVEDVLEVRVQDSGVGIPADKLTEIFELFAQVDRSLERDGGLGIGLTLARQLIGMHRGTIEARSDGPGHGSVFLVRLPIASPVKSVPAMAARGARALPSRSRRVLVADDNRDAADSMALLIGAAGHEVRVAYDGLEAVSVAEAFQPDIVFLDIGMPKRNGYDVARSLREARGSSIRIVALTGWGQESDRRRSGEAGFDTHLVKPVPPEVFAQILRDAGTMSSEELIPES